MPVGEQRQQQRFDHVALPDDRVGERGAQIGWAAACSWRASPRNLERGTRVGDGGTQIVVVGEGAALQCDQQLGAAPDRWLADGATRRPAFRLPKRRPCATRRCARAPRYARTLGAQHGQRVFDLWRRERATTTGNGSGGATGAGIGIGSGSGGAWRPGRPDRRRSRRRQPREESAAPRAACRAARPLALRSRGGPATLQTKRLEYRCFGLPSRGVDRLQRRRRDRCVPAMMRDDGDRFAILRAARAALRLAFVARAARARPASAARGCRSRMRSRARAACTTR